MATMIQLVNKAVTCYDYLVTFNNHKLIILTVQLHVVRVPFPYKDYYIVNADSIRKLLKCRDSIEEVIKM